MTSQLLGTGIYVLIPGTDDITVAMLMAGCGQVGPVEGEWRVGEDPLVGEAEATGRDPWPLHPTHHDSKSIIHNMITL